MSKSARDRNNHKLQGNAENGLGRCTRSFNQNALFIYSRTHGEAGIRIWRVGPLFIRGNGRWSQEATDLPAEQKVEPAYVAEIAGGQSSPIKLASFQARETRQVTRAFATAPGRSGSLRDHDQRGVSLLSHPKDQLELCKFLLDEGLDVDHVAFSDDCRALIESFLGELKEFTNQVLILLTGVCQSMTVFIIIMALKGHGKEKKTNAILR
ncbi:hypothetical protein NOF04DRAFT_1270613 [Fusarium oxysporum II5]|nr:hypothetical protein NOF04DRAFT_1270613 [Fusarium oxysporum II5]